MTDSPVTLWPLTGPRPPHPPWIAFYIEAGEKPENGRFAITLNDLKRSTELTT
ncbi:hypothetical protein [Pseudomonas sp. PD9R]|uniref:hypothetical protein n=1 Tax=Pseudomonas sp. PD9R TaxID=2853534 RepID=UPI001C490124|nr:hypothetical protein [Pseudomonas sp. PD9R]MBV6821378.1 hypothetical protein [Pseudomonas sp. PD9R]